MPAIFHAQRSSAQLVLNVDLKGQGEGGYLENNLYKSYFSFHLSKVYLN